MSVTLDAIRKMSVAERLQLIGDIWDTLEDEQEAVPLTEAQRRELDRRLEEHRANPEAAVPWEELEQELKAEGL